MFRTVMAAAARPLIAGCVAAALAGAPSRAAEEDKVIATVDGAAITETDLALAGQDYAQDLAQVPEEARAKLLLDVLIDMHVLANAAIKAGMEKDPAVEKSLAYLRLRTLRDSYFSGPASLEPDEAAIKARYDATYADFKGPEERHARHILVKTKEEADALIAELDAGKDFAELAKEKSTGPTGPTGGDLGFFSAERMVKPFADAAFAMEVGTYSKAPVETQFGWHVIKLEGTRTQPAPEFDQVRAQLRTEVIRETFAKVMEGLKAEAKIEIVDAPQEAAPADAAPAEADKKN